MLDVVVLLDVLVRDGSSDWLSGKAGRAFSVSVSRGGVSIGAGSSWRSDIKVS